MAADTCRCGSNIGYYEGIRSGTCQNKVIAGLGTLGVLGMAAPRALGGRSFSQSAYCKIMEVIGGHCASTAVFVNAHHSIGIRALLLFGTALVLPNATVLAGMAAVLLLLTRGATRKTLA